MGVCVSAVKEVGSRAVDVMRQGRGSHPCSIESFTLAKEVGRAMKRVTVRLPSQVKNSAGSFSKSSSWSRGHKSFRKSVF